MAGTPPEGTDAPDNSIPAGERDTNGHTIITVCFAWGVCDSCRGCWVPAADPGPGAAEVGGSESETRVDVELREEVDTTTLPLQ